MNGYRAFKGKCRDNVELSMPLLDPCNIFLQITPICIPGVSRSFYPGCGVRKNPLRLYEGGDGTRGRTRTGTPAKAMDFESIMSTNFITLALLKLYYFLLGIQNRLRILNPARLPVPPPRHESRHCTCVITCFKAPSKTTTRISIPVQIKLKPACRRIQRHNSETKRIADAASPAQGSRQITRFDRHS